MATNARTPENGTERDLPGGWERVESNGLEREQFAHTKTALVVTIEDDQRPDQMHDPRTAQMDTGYTTWVHGGSSGTLCARLASKTVAKQTAREFMAEYPDGGYTVPVPAEQPLGDQPLDWRDD